MPFDTRTTATSLAKGGVEGTTGFYRFTDIYFEWYAHRVPLGRVSLAEGAQRHQVLPNQEDVSPLKALLNYNALVHPDHPLRKPGVNGIELQLGLHCAIYVPADVADS